MLVMTGVLSRTSGEMQKSHMYRMLEKESLRKIIRILHLYFVFDFYVGHRCTDDKNIQQCHGQIHLLEIQREDYVDAVSHQLESCGPR